MAAPARALDLDGLVSHTGALRALEGRVLGEVREPFFARAFVGRSDLGPDLEVGDGGNVRFAQQHRQPVGQDFVVDGRR